LQHLDIAVLGLRNVIDLHAYGERILQRRLRWLRWWFLIIAVGSAAAFMLALLNR
jgi:hypothetical protein